MTYLEAVNAVLKKLRVDTVTAVSDTTYSAMIGEFLKDVLEEVQDSWDWQTLRLTLQVDTVSDIHAYSLVDAGKKFKILSVWNDTEEEWLTEKNSYWLTSRLNYTPIETNIPQFWGINGYDANEDPIIDMYPVPNGIYTINFNMVVPQYTEEMTDNTVIRLPTTPIIYGTWAMAISERGEDGGMSFNEIEAKYRMKWADAVSIDARSAPDELVLYL